MLDQERKREEDKDLDPRRSLYFPVQLDPRERERGGGAPPQVEEEQGGYLHLGKTSFLLPGPYFSSTSPAAASSSSSDYARFPGTMGYDQLSFLHHQQQLQQQERRPQSRSRYRGAGGGAAAVMGDIVEVQGGHIVRSTGRKDRHSKVCTAKGPRDRRVRLAAHTAIQFYDVQDRLGYDRPSKAVDWLIKNAKSAIDELAELPPWSPSATLAAAAASRAAPVPVNHSPSPELSIGDSSRKLVTSRAEHVVSTSFAFDRSGGNDGASFLPPSLDTDAIADTIKSFFPVATAATAPPPSSTPNSIGFIGTSSQAQDLRLSLQSFQDPIFHIPEPNHQQHHHNQLSFDATSAADWAAQSQRLVSWNVAEQNDVGCGYMVSFPPPQQAPPLQSVLAGESLLSQRGPLQSSNNLPTVRAWADPVDTAAEHRMQFALHPSMSSIGFASGVAFSGFRVPAQLQGDEEHDSIAGKPPSTSRH